MARPKGGVKKGAASGPGSAKPTALTIKGSLNWRAWVDRGARFCRTDVAKLVDAALTDYLKARGFDEAPPER